MTDSETASYVLAYLLKHNYSQTASTFLQECQVLPSKSLLILPETPLHSLIAEHKLRSDATILLSRMGPSSTWRALWDKLHTTLEQLKMVFEEEPVLQTQTHGTSSLSQRPRVTQLRKPAFRQPPTQPSPLPTHSSPPPTHSSQPSQETPHNMTLSPHRKKPVPKRKELTESPLRGPPLSPSTQHMFDSLMGDEQLPAKLADIINRCVSRDDLTSERSPLTLDTIVDRTYSDPALEGLLTHASLDHVIPLDGHVIPPVGHVIPPDGHVMPPDGHVMPPDGHVMPPDGHVIPPVGHVIPPDGHVILSDGEHSIHSSDSSLLSPPPAKKPRVDDMTQQDIEDFLDQLHS